EHDSAQADRYQSQALFAPRRDEAPGDPDTHKGASRQSRWRSLHPRAAQTAAERGRRPPGGTQEPGRDPARRLSKNLVRGKGHNEANVKEKTASGNQG